MRKRPTSTYIPATLKLYYATFQFLYKISQNVKSYNLKRDIYGSFVTTYASPCCLNASCNGLIRGSVRLVLLVAATTLTAKIFINKIPIQINQICAEPTLSQIKSTSGDLVTK